MINPSIRGLGYFCIRFIFLQFGSIFPARLTAFCAFCWLPWTGSDWAGICLAKSTTSSPEYPNVTQDLPTRPPSFIWRHSCHCAKVSIFHLDSERGASVEQKWLHNRRTLEFPQQRVPGLKKPLRFLMQSIRGRFVSISHSVVLPSLQSFRIVIPLSMRVKFRNWHYRFWTWECQQFGRDYIGIQIWCRGASGACWF